MRDGAQDALVGYLYQFVGVASLRARAITATDLEQELSCELIASVQKGTLHHEQQGQDALVRVSAGDRDETVAIQFKYSRTVERRVMPRNEVIDVVHAFDRSRRFAASQGVAIDRYVLVTNRTLDTTADALFQKRMSATTPKELVLREHTNDGRIIESNQPIVKEYGSALAAAQAWHEVFRRLTISENVHFASFLTNLRDLALHHGLSDAEFDAALVRLVGSVIDATVQGPFEVDAGWLTRCLVGAQDALTLHFASKTGTARVVAAEKLHTFLKHTFVEGENTLIRRNLMERVWEAIDQFPVVFLTGDGGCGKSVLAVQSLLTASRERLTLGGFRVALDMAFGALSKYDFCFVGMGFPEVGSLGMEANGVGSKRILESADQAKSPRRILVRSLLKSRNKLREKYRELRAECKRWRNQAAAVERSRSTWRERALAHEASAQEDRAARAKLESQLQQLREQSERREVESAELCARLAALEGAEKKG